MSKSGGFGFQGGAFVEVFTPQGKDPTAGWKVSGSVKKIFDKEVKSYVYVLEGVPTTTRLQLSKDGKTTVTLVQRYLVLQLHLAKGQDFSLELGVTDLGKNKRRVLFSTSQRDIQTTPLHAKIPLSIVKRGVWLNLCFDLASLVADTWKGQTFRSVEAISVSANCKLRRVFTMKLPPADTTDDDEVYDLGSPMCEIDQIPRQCQLAPDIHQLTQVFTMSKLRAIERIKSGHEGTRRSDSMLDIDLNASTRRSMQNDSNSYRIAFGSKVAVTTSRRHVKDNLSSSRSSRLSSSRVDDSISARNTVKDGGRDSSANHIPQSPLIDQSKSDTAALGSKQLDTQGDLVRTELAFSQPHPPREPSKDRQRRRIRVKGHGSDSVNSGQTKDDTSRKEVFVPGLNNATSNDEDANSSSNSKFSSDGDLEDMGVGELVTEDKSLQTPRFRDFNARPPAETRDSGVGPFVPEIQSPRKESADGVGLEESMSDVIRMLRSQTDVTTSEDSDSDTNVEEYIESDDAEENGVYMFASPPKSAPHRNLSPSQEEDPSQSRKLSKTSYLRKLNGSLSSRGARLDSDFMDSASSDSDGEVTSRQKVTARAHSGGKSSSGRPRQEAQGGKTISAEDSYRHLPSMGGRHSEYSPENYRNRGAGDVTLSPRLNASSMSRMSRKSLREIPRTDARLSLAKPAEIFGAYDHTKYQVVEELTDSFEARMLASLKRQQDEDDSQGGGARSVTDSCQRDLAPPEGHARSQQLLHVEESPTTTSDDDTSFSTWKAPAAGQLVHNYQEEMRYPQSRLSSDTLTSSNPRDWSGVFSPPVGLPGDTGAVTSRDADKVSGETNHSDSPGREEQADADTTGLPNGDRAATRQEEELDLLYDPCLNCYFDPQTCKYYELV